ncbi:MAG: RdgB/HAM1 family non-canonical purine NTP pyrophosphatase [Chloroflexia bacterium]
MPTLLIATTNPGKLQEFRDLFGSVPAVRVVSPNDIEVWVEVAETGETLEENALLKARALHNALPDEMRHSGVWVLGDDSGLEVDALGGAPGVHSNRWAGPDTTAAQRNEMLLERLQDVPDEERTARFKCVIALIEPGGKEYILEGAVEGRIAHELRGTGGFGYDPLFELPDGRRMAELPPEAKNALSHRGVAGVQAASILANAS